jgi:hypothetical protein
MQRDKLTSDPKYISTHQPIQFSSMNENELQPTSAWVKPICLKCSYDHYLMENYEMQNLFSDMHETDERDYMTRDYIN